jgi:hypothetical protein
MPLLLLQTGEQIMIPDYYVPWPEQYSFDEREPDLIDDLELKSKFEQGWFDEPEEDEQ